MRNLSSVIILSFGFIASLLAQNPHGANLKIDCASCHSPKGWEISASYWQGFDPDKPRVSQVTGMVWGPDTLRFHHSKTSFELKGQHRNVDCRACHETLVFSDAPSDCVSCHSDVHQQTVGTDCARCHTPANWLIDNIPELHVQNGFPLTGVHQPVSCEQCHTAAPNLLFNRVGNDCISCHLQDFQASTNPNHQQAGFSTDCLECHDVTTPDWGTDKVNHDFFPLTKGHEISDCRQCHIDGNFSQTPTNCNACHMPDFESAQSPNHVSAHYSNDCASCHTTDSDWMPARFTAHDAQYFPIYSGKHNGQWSECTDCHTNASNYAEYSCTTCHVNPETNDGHSGVNGYVYENTACLACHPTGDAGTAFDHNTTNFPLTGAHLQANCVDCHAAGYVGTPTQCSACHTADFNQTTNPNHVALNISTDCAMCHTTAPGWEPATFPTHGDYYALNGAHAAIANDCAACHNGNYNSTPNTCAGCHTPDYNATANPNHTAAQFPTDCAMCHSETAWTPSSFDHNAFYPIAGAHTAIANDCNACHNGNYTNTPNTCAGCHTPDYNATSNPNHASAHFPTDCAMCHTQTAWSPSSFDHNAIYPFTGAHLAIADDCNACHNGNYTNTPNTCAGCHTTDFNQTSNPNHVALNIPTDCAMCHTTAPGWEPAAFPIHSNYYALNGAHAAIANDCASCHNGNYNNTPNTCAGCHTPDYNATTNPNHAAAQFPTDCATCHTDAAWTPSTFNHNTFYPITGAHMLIANDCNACHNGNYTNTPNTCAGCHTPDYNATTNPNHAAAQFPTDCATCHTDAAWTPSTFNHNTFYPITGAHTLIANDCNACHNGNYTNTPNTCAGCHTPDYNATTNPNHAAAQFPTDCATCHTDAAWTPSTFNHNTFYPITGAHTLIANDCNACHNGNYTNTPNTCAGCHTPDYNATTNPNHAAAQFPTDCATCHTDAAWTPSSFNHNTFYPITGAHTLIANDCNACHNGNYTNTPNTCAGCHTPDYNATTNPNHAAAQFPTDCATCHTDAAWTPSTFNHNTFYPITGAHTLIANDCNACHNGNYTNTPNTCAGCHTPDYNATTNPNHAAAQFPTDCATCHTDAAWAPSNFDHNVFYPFTGAHIPIANDCNACHNGNYTNTPNTCAGCHTTDFNQTSNPNHVALNIPTDCAMCHTTAPGWDPATFPIHNNYYALHGAHAAIASDCATCHNGNYNSTPNTCAGCHTPDYNATTNPNHAAAQFPTDCATCHSETAWAPSTFDHNAFYPFTGAHIPIANGCNACHNGNYTNTPNTCAGCHTTDFNQATNPNHVALNIPTNCAMCHTTDPGWDPATFPIHNNYYALNGAHAAIANDCAACHNGNYNNTPTTCNGCHMPDYNATTNPNHSVLHFSTQCATCHSETTWTPSNFDHSNYYPFTGAHIPIAGDCNACHHGNYNNTPTTCNGCHMPDYNSSSNPSHVSLNLSTNCATCHTTAPAWQPAAFAVHNTYWPLTGAHASVSCNECHANGNYNNTPTNCYGCHAADYNSANNPNHAAEGYPTACQTCHTVNAWDPSTFNHDQQYFRIYSGNHNGAWDACIECHTTPGNFEMFSCTDCHEHSNATQLANHHQGVSGYQHNSAACYSCHPHGN